MTHRLYSGKTDWLLPVLAIMALLASEWLFFYTKASFLSPYTSGQTLAMWLRSVALLSTVTVLPLAFLQSWLRRRRPGWAWLPSVGLRLIAAVLLTATSLLLVDNFFLTLFHFGVRDSHGLTRGLYLVLLASLLGYWVRACLRAGPWQPRTATGISLAVLLVLAGGTGLLLKSAVRNGLATTTQHASAPGAVRSNVLLFNGDGLNARNLSAYGYARDTTPFLKSMLGEMLVAQNHFTNSAHTAGSIAALLTGKGALTTRVIYPPDILHGADAYQHLPGLLRQIGYRSINISMSHFADPLDMNMRGAFDVSNGRAAQAASNILIGDNVLTRTAPLASFFLGEILRRLSQRVAHIFFLADMPHDFAEVTQQRRASIGDRRRIAQFKAFVQRSGRPFFAHIHLMETHGKRFRPQHRRWSLKESQTRVWMTDYYDDAIAEFDHRLRVVIQFLKDEKLLESTILVVGSDHGMNHRADERLPLLIRFPHSAHRGVIQANTQRIDVAPTLLDYLGMPVPKWMEGRSLLDAAALNPGRPIFSVNARKRPKSTRGSLQSVDFAPPYYSLQRLSMVLCNQYWELDLRNNHLRETPIPGYPSGCKDVANTPPVARALLEARLRKAHYPLPGD